MAIYIDSRYRGVVINGTGEWKGFEVKVFYVEGSFSGPVRVGDIVGQAQNVARKYPGITNHVHLEVRKNGKVLSPFEVFGSCF